MRFGGHETFSIREGWLHKGLKLLIERPERLVDEYAADWLGVGRNMAKSIRHWLVATGLAKQLPRKGSQRIAHFQETELGRLIYEKDLYFGELGTWWTLHVNLVNNPKYAASWEWFFNNFSLTRFERAVCIEGLHRYLQLSTHSNIMPSLNTLHRDVACLLNTYAKKIPPERDDPEEAKDCPFTELGIMTYFRASGYYQIHKGPKEIPSQIFNYALAKKYSPNGDKEGALEVPIREAAQVPGGPGKSFVLTSESLFEVCLRIENQTENLQISGLAGERRIRIPQRNPLEWLNEYYATIDQEDRNAA